MEIYMKQTERLLENKVVVGWTSSRLTTRLLNLKRPHLDQVEQVFSGNCNLQRHKKTTGRAESSLSPKCSLADETPIASCFMQAIASFTNIFVLDILGSPRPLFTLWYRNVTLPNWQRT